MIFLLDFYDMSKSPSGDADFFPGGPLPKLRIVGITDFHMLHPMPFVPRKEILCSNMSNVFSFGVELSGTGKQFSWGVSSVEHRSMYVNYVKYKRA